MGNIELTKKVPLELLCLLLLQERDMYGYEMAQALKKRSDGLVIISVTTLYLALKRMADRDWVSMYYGSAGGDSRERSRLYYHIEAKGMEYAKELLFNYRQAVRGVQMFLDSCPGTKEE